MSGNIPDTATSHPHTAHSTEHSTTAHDSYFPPLSLPPLPPPPTFSTRIRPDLARSASSSARLVINNNTIPTNTTRPHPLKRLSLDLPDQSYSHSTSTDAYTTPITPIKETGHVGITRRRPSVSSPRAAKTNPLESGKLKSPTAGGGGLGWLGTGRLALPHDTKLSKSDDEREDDVEELDKKPRRIVTNRRMPGLLKNGEGVGSAPMIGIIPTTSVKEEPSPPTYPLALPSVSPSPIPQLHPLPLDPHNILPLSVTSTPSGSRVPSPHQSMSDISSNLLANPPVGSLPGPGSAIGPMTSNTGSSPRTSTSTSSSRLGWPGGRSGSRSSEEDDLPPLLSTAPSSSRTWFSNAGAIPVSPKINIAPPRVMRLGSGRLPIVGTRRWGWLFEWLGLESLLDAAGKPDSPKVGKTRRDRERERLMNGPNPTTPGWRRNQRVLGSKWLARVWVFVPTEPWSITMFLVFLAAFAVSLTLTIKHILNPDKDALPWRQYCTSSYPTLYSLQDPSSSSISSTSSSNVKLMPIDPEHPVWPYKPHLSPPVTAESPQHEIDGAFPPVGVLIGVFTIDSGIERRHMIRQSYASHWRSRREGTEGVSVKFVMGRPRKRYERDVALEMEAFDDIVLLDMDENMNSGKTHTFFSWAAENATVPDWEYPLHPRAFPDEDSQKDRGALKAPVWRGVKRPDYVVKADEDSFIMLGELEKRLRVAPREKSFWGYLVKNTFMAGECYALSFDLVQYVASFPALRGLTKGKEDKLVAKWMGMHPQREEIVWSTERCWMYDHPKAGTVYSHGFIYPSTVSQVRFENTTGLSVLTLAQRGGPDAADAYSTVSKFGVTYRPLAEDLTAGEQVEALVEGSPISLLREEARVKKENQKGHQQAFSKPSSNSVLQQIHSLYASRPTRQERFNGDKEERGGTVVVHYIKKAEWFVETMVAMLGGSGERAWEHGYGGTYEGLSATSLKKRRHAERVKVAREKGL